MITITKDVLALIKEKHYNFRRLMRKCTYITPNRISLDRLLKKIDSKDVSKDGENR